MPCYDERSTAGYVQEHEVRPLQEEVSRLTNRNNDFARMLCGIGRALEADRRHADALHTVLAVPGFKDWWENHKIVDAERGHDGDDE